MTYSLKDLEYLVGLDRVPTKGGVPAAWWISVHPEQINAYDRWARDYNEHVVKVGALAQTFGLDATAGRISGFPGHSFLAGFDAPQSMLLWPGHPDHRPVPNGWRLDRKKNRLVPSRKTKADRESDVSKAFKDVQRIPDVTSYMTGMPTEVCLDDRDFGGTLYGIQYRRGTNCVHAYCGGDPDRASRERGATDSDVWQRQKLSDLVALRELADAS